MAASSSITTFNYSHASVPIFEGESYDLWSSEMKTFFISQDLWEVVEEGYESPENDAELESWTESKQNKFKENKIKDAKALFYIQQGVSKTIAPRIMETTKSKEAWDNLKKDFQGLEKEYKIDIEISPELEGEIGSSATQPKVEDPSYLRMMNSLCDRVQKLSDTLNQWSIFRVPSRLREPNEDAYTPRIVSIGPIHSGQENLQAMEVHKTWYMQTIFKRTKYNDQTLSACVKAILSQEEIARSYYCDYQTLVSNDKSLAEILLVDGCFLLELFIRRWDSTDNSTHDPIFGAGTICSLQHDLALLENQIPFFVLECLFNLIMPNTEIPIPSVNQLCASFFDLKLNSNQSPESSSSSCRHLLDLIRSCYLPRHSESDEADAAINCCVWSKSRTKQKPKKSWEVIHSATKLRESGIKFAAQGTSENLFDIKFNPKLGVLEIPKLCIDDAMDSLLRNMIAFEQCCHGTSYHITSYAVLMDCLIDSPGDAEFPFCSF